VISADLLLPANAEVLRDTLLHEMAHGEAWLRHGHRGHGKIWRRIAERVGCVPRALTQTRVARHRRNRGRAVA
jgi:predicted SprT family Zn-dependent metalloprotease